MFFFSKNYSQNELSNADIVGLFQGLLISTTHKYALFGKIIPIFNDFRTFHWGFTSSVAATLFIHQFILFSSNSISLKFSLGGIRRKIERERNEKGVNF